MSTTTFTHLLLCFACSCPLASAEPDQPPSNISIQEAFTAEEEAARALDYLLRLYQEITYLQGQAIASDGDTVSASRLQELNTKLDEFCDHLKANPDFRSSVQYYLEQILSLEKNFKKKKISIYAAPSSTT